MRHLTRLFLLLMLLASSCGGDETGSGGSDAPPWGLDQIDMPDTDEEVAAVMASFPDEIDGLSRSGGSPFGVMYGESGIFWIVQGQPSDQIEFFAPPGIGTPVEWLEYVGSGRTGGTIEERALIGDVMWVAANEEWEVAPGQMGKAHVLHWAQPGGSWVFFLQAGSEAGRIALVEAFVAAAAGGDNAAIQTTVVPTEPSTLSTVVGEPLPAPPTTTAPDAEVIPEPVDEPAGNDYPVEGVAADEPEIFLAELEALRNSAGPGRIVGMVHLQDPDHTFPIAETQPYCVGAGDFKDITPGLVVTVEEVAAVHTTILRGSVVDAHTGCSLWFGVNVPDADSYTVTVGGHSVMFDRAYLSAVGWTVALWSDPRSLQAECEENPGGEGCNRSTVLE